VRGQGRGLINFDTRRSLFSWTALRAWAKSRTPGKPHVQGKGEKARRRRQIDRGQLTVANGLFVDPVIITEANRRMVELRRKQKPAWTRRESGLVVPS
jgi:hypothetical protein